MSQEPSSDQTAATPEDMAGAPAPVAATGRSDESILEQVKVIIEEIRPFIQSDGGDIELLKVEDQIVYVRLTGACVGCPSSMITLKHGVEARIREEIPDVESVEMV